MFPTTRWSLIAAATGFWSAVIHHRFLSPSSPLLEESGVATPHSKTPSWPPEKVPLACNLLGRLLL
jgi:hypothetical protein